MRATGYSARSSTGQPGCKPNDTNQDGTTHFEPRRPGWVAQRHKGGGRRPGDSRGAAHTSILGSEFGQRAPVERPPRLQDRAGGALGSAAVLRPAGSPFMPLRRVRHRPALGACLRCGAPRAHAAGGTDRASQRGHGGARRAGDTSSGARSVPSACQPEPQVSRWKTKSNVHSSCRAAS